MQEEDLKNWNQSVILKRNADVKEEITVAANQSSDTLER